VLCESASLLVNCALFSSLQISGAQPIMLRTTWSDKVRIYDQQPMNRTVTATNILTLPIVYYCSFSAAIKPSAICFLLNSWKKRDEVTYMQQRSDPADATEMHSPTDHSVTFQRNKSALGHLQEGGFWFSTISRDTVTHTPKRSNAIEITMKAFWSSPSNRDIVIYMTMHPDLVHPNKIVSPTRAGSANSMSW